MQKNTQHSGPLAAVEVRAVAETAQDKFERERLSRRQALKRFGMTSAMATFALFSVDDLARMVGKAMQQRAGDNKVAEQVAKEFQQSGMAFAKPPNRPPLPSGCSGDQVGNWCLGYSTTQDCVNCCDGVYGSGGMCSTSNTYINHQTCINDCWHPGGCPY